MPAQISHISLFSHLFHANCKKKSCQVTGHLKPGQQVTRVIFPKVKVNFSNFQIPRHLSPTSNSATLIEQWIPNFLPSCRVAIPTKCTSLNFDAYNLWVGQYRNLSSFSKKTMQPSLSMIIMTCGGQTFRYDDMWPIGR